MTVLLEKIGVSRPALFPVYMEDFLLGNFRNFWHGPGLYGNNVSVENDQNWFIAGHSDVVMGALMTNREDLYNRLKYLQNGKKIILNFSSLFPSISSFKTVE